MATSHEGVIAILRRRLENWHVLGSKMMQWRVMWVGVWLALSLGAFVGADDKEEKPSEKPAAPKEDAPKPQADKVEAGKAQADKEEPKPGRDNDAPKPVTPQKPKPAGENPLQRLLQQFNPRPVPPKVPAQPFQQQGANANGKSDKTPDPEARDHIDARAPKDRKQVDLLKKAAAAIEKGDWSNAVDLLNGVLGQDQDGVERTTGEGWLSVRERALRLMRKLPSEIVQTFRQRWGAEAQRRLDEATHEGRADQIASVAYRFLWTDAGQAAADRLGARHLDRGEAELATLWFQRLLDVAAPITQSRRWQLRAAMAARLAGNDSQADRWLKGTDAADSKLDEAERLSIGGESHAISEWWKSLKTNVAAALAQTDWPMSFGSSNRAASFAKGTPLLLPRWTQSLTQFQPIQQQIEMLVEDWHDINRSTMTVSQPLLVDGLVAVRTLIGVQVFDLQRGQLRWSTADRLPVESLASNKSLAVMQNNGMNANGWVGGRIAVSVDASGSGVDQNGLAQLLFLNGNFGQLSSDGRQLFVVEDDTFVGSGVLNVWGADTELSRRDPLKRNWSSNKLVSYDLHNGQVLWSVGGPASTEALQAELSGVFFFGAATPDGDDLFIVGERDGEVRLFCLELETGKLRWSQLLAMAELSISRDPVRRSFMAQVAISDGVVVCPTTVGWLAGVDRASHQLLWVHRYSQPQIGNGAGRRMQNQAMTVALNWGQRWLTATPVIVGESVVYTPQEVVDEAGNVSGVICLGLHDGRTLWAKPKASNWLAMNGVADNKVLVVGHNQFVALSLADGKELWSVPVQQGEGILSGLGSVAGDQWHLPLSSGQLWTLALKDGAIVSKQWGPPKTMLGNLSMSRGSLISVHAAGMSCFEQRESIAAQIQESKKTDPNNAHALMTEASILLRSRDTEGAWKVLQQIDESSVSAESRTRFRDVCRDALTTLIQFRPETHGAELTRLERLIDSPVDRLVWQRLKLSELRGRNELVAALGLLLEIARGDLEQTMLMPSVPERSVRLSAWLSGQLVDLWEAMSPEVRSSVEPQFATELSAVVGDRAEGDSVRDRPQQRESRQRMLDLFGFHPLAKELRWREVEQLIAEKDFSQAELLLLRATESDDASEVARAWQRMLALYLAHGLTEDAVIAGQRLKGMGDVKLSDDMTAAKFVEQEVAAGRLALQSAVSSASADWNSLTFQMDRSLATPNLAEAQECSVSDSTWPFFVAKRWQYQATRATMTTQRLIVAGYETQPSTWSLPLRQKSGSPFGGGIAVRTVGHEMLVYHGEVLHMLSPVDRRVLWTRPTESRGNYFDPQQVLRRIPLPMLMTHEFVTRQADAADEAQRNGLLTLCSTELVAYRGRRSLTVVDAATGKWRWELRDVPNDTRFQTTRDLIFFSSQKWPNGLLLRSRDGSEMPLDETVRKSFQNSKLSVDGDLIVVTRATHSEKTEVAVERWNPLRKASIWKRSFTVTDQFAWLDQQSLVTLSTDHTLNLTDLDTGEQRKIGSVKGGDSANRNLRRYVISDRERVFLIVAAEQQNANNDNMTIPANGMIYAFDRRVGGELWKQTMENQNLIVQQFAASPVLFFSSRRADQPRAVLGQVNQFNQPITSSLVLLDKKSGRKLFEGAFANPYGNFRGMNLNLTERYWELLTYNERVRIVGEEKRGPEPDAKSQ